MEKTFKIGSSKPHNNGYRFPKSATATVVAEVIILNGEEFIAGAVYTDGNYLAGSMCRCWDKSSSFEDFCSALLRKAYGNPSIRKERTKYWEGINIYGRKFRKCSNPHPWENVGNEELEDGFLGPDIWEFQLKGSKLLSTSRR